MHKSEHKDSVSIPEYFPAWAGNPSGSVVAALTGPSHSGKTVALRLTTQRFLELRKHDPCRPLPVLLNMERGVFETKMGIADIIDECLRVAGNTRGLNLPDWLLRALRRKASRMAKFYMLAVTIISEVRIIWSILLTLWPTMKKNFSHRSM